MNGVKCVFISLVLLCSCVAPRNIDCKQKEDIAISKIASGTLEFDGVSNFDFSSTKIKEIVFNKVEYFPPDSNGQCHIKSEESLSIKQEDRQNEVSSDTATLSSDSIVVDDKVSTNIVEVSEDVAEDPYKWRYILGIIITITIIAIVVYMKLKGSKLLSSICSFLKH